MKRLARSLRSLVAFIKGGPGGKPQVTHHHLHRD